MSDVPTLSAYPTTPCIAALPLPDIFVKPGSAQRLTSQREWPEVADAWGRLILDTEYGGMPPQPETVRFEEHHRSIRRTWPGEPSSQGFKIHCTGGVAPFSLRATLYLPRAEGPVPVVINGDACWPRKEEVILAVLARGYGLLLFDRTEAARDINDRAARMTRAGGLYDIYPGLGFGALSAWAWAYSRCVDLLHSLPGIDRERIAVSGHSRGGKTCLLAGLCDARIALINDNGGCAGGSATYRYVGDGGETVGIVNAFPDWFDPRMRAFIGHEADLPFDQHCLLAALAPRPLLLTYALDDRWSNPEGMVQAYWGAREAYRFLAAEERIAFHLRSGDHAHNSVDWNALLDFMDRQWRGLEVATAFNRHPYAHLRPAFSWSAPQG